MDTPTDRRYTETHEWHLLDGDTLTIGLTRFAVDQLTDITYVEMHPLGREIEAGDGVGEVESVKMTADVWCKLGGTVTAHNPTLAADPGLLNRDPYGEGWLVRLKVTDPGPYEDLMDAEAYAQHAVM